MTRSSDTDRVLLEAYSASCSVPSGTDWNERESIAHSQLCQSFMQLHGADISPPSVYLGGDSLRPYLLLNYNNHIWTISNVRRGLSVPRLISEIDSGTFGSIQKAVKRENRLTHVVRHLPASDALKLRLTPPTVCLASLTNASRYQARRYPLNVARLSQWLRFQHVARVKVLDLALNCAGKIQLLAQSLITARPDVIGISVNFGEIESLRELISHLRDSEQRPTLCLGNVLAAWEPQEMEQICSGFNVNISESYGERDLEEVCLAYSAHKGTSFAVHQSSNYVKVRNSSFPSSIVLPDENLLAETLSKGGQISIETSFGCQYGLCTFCPRDHRGKGWRRPCEDATAVVTGMARLIRDLGSEPTRVLSIVDEEAFGEEGLIPGIKQPSIVKLVNVAAIHGVSCEIYTRAEQIFDRRKPKPESILRLSDLSLIRESLSRMFVGVESGSDSQLRRYGKGQTSDQVVDALRAGSTLGLPLEFGFITFDPLLTEQELWENLRFLARADVVLPPNPTRTPEEVYSSVLSGFIEATPSGEPLFARVAYMATELELFAHSSFARGVLQSHPELITGYDSSFARYNYAYKDGVISQIANWCRVWTEGTFEPIYKLRLASRSLKHPGQQPSQTIVRRYREATFALLVDLASYYSDHIRSSLQASSHSLRTAVPIDLGSKAINISVLTDLWKWVVADSAHSDSNDAYFRLETLRRRRAA